MTSVRLCIALLLATLSSCADELPVLEPIDSEDTRAVEIALQAVDGARFDSLRYLLTGGPSALHRSGAVVLRDTEQPRFQLGNLPTGSGYRLLVWALSLFAQHCHAELTFDVLPRGLTRLRATLRCDEPPPRDRGKVEVAVDVTAPASRSCPVVTGISALPLSVYVGAELSLEAFTSSPGDRIRWQTKGPGSFAPPNQALTQFRCQGQPGARLVEVVLSTNGCPDSRDSVEVTCEPAPP